MIAGAAANAERREWSVAAGVALCAHVAVGLLVVGWTHDAQPPAPEPVVMVELPPETAPVPAVAAPAPPTAAQPVSLPRSPTPPTPITPPIDLPPVRQPLPRDAVTLPPPVPQPHRAAATADPAPAAPAAPAATPPQRAAVAAAAAAPGSSDPKARQKEADYFALVSAHLNRRKVYPVEARKARQQGVVTVRFTVDRSGNVSAASIKRSSGHGILDDATLALLQRVAPLPKMPASMPRDSVTLSLPIDYSLRTS